MTEGEQIILDNLGPAILSAAKEGRMADLLQMMVMDHLDLLCRPMGMRFALAALLVIRRGRHGDDYVPFGCIPDAVRGGVRRMKDGAYTRGETMDLAAHDVVAKGEAAAVEARLGSGVTVMSLLKERYGVVLGDGDARTDAKRFRGLLKDARFRLRKMKADAERRAHWRRVKAWNRDVPGRVM